MLRSAAATGLVGLGLVGGVGAVTYDDDGTATVTIENQKKGTKQTVKIGDGSGKGYSCPAGIDASLSRHDIKLGRIKLTLRPVERQLRRLDKQYPGSTAPGPVVERFNALVRREKRLVSAYNQAVDSRNAVLTRDCRPSG